LDGALLALLMLTINVAGGPAMAVLIGDAMTPDNLYRLESRAPGMMVGYLFELTALVLAFFAIDPATPDPTRAALWVTAGALRYIAFPALFTFTFDLVEN
jgi:hypothetical protein